MRTYDLIEKKKRKLALNKEELSFLVDGIVNNNIPDYQISALLMAIYFQSMTEVETAEFTGLMAHSGDVMELSTIKGFKVDKHSTGGVGDKTTLIVAPIVAACQVKVAKMSGRGLGHTGGTIDKLESIAGFMTSMTTEEFFKTVNQTGLAVVGQTGNMVPADKKLYSLRDVTATVDSIPLIAASIMSKKIAAGADGIVLDVKTGSGAFMKTTQEAVKLAQAMVDIGVRNNKKMVALITNMEVPLGFAVGNSLEVIEALEILNGSGSNELKEVCLMLSANMIYLSGAGTIEHCYSLALDALSSKKALGKFREMVSAQGGDVTYVDDKNMFAKASIVHSVIAREEGFLNSIDALEIGTASVVLGAGRITKDSEIDHSAGIVLNFSVGSVIKKGDTLAFLHSNDMKNIKNAENMVINAIKINQEKPPTQTLIIGRVSEDGVVLY